MSSIYYKFKSTLQYKTLTFDGLHMYVDDFKTAIYERENIKANLFDLVLTNATTKFQYQSNDIIPRCSSIIVQRVPKNNEFQNSKAETKTNYPWFYELAKKTKCNEKKNQTKKSVLTIRDIFGDKNQDAVPIELSCSICNNILSKAVLTTCCGDSFCYKCAMQQISRNQNCPNYKCRQKLIAKNLIPNNQMRELVEHYLSSETSTPADEAA